MNRDFMEFMRANYPDVIKSTHPKYGSIITADDVKEERARAQEQEVDMFDWMGLVPKGAQLVLISPSHLGEIKT